MRNWICGLLVISWLSTSLLSGPASGTYREAGGAFSIGYALAHRAEDGSVQILLTRQEPELPNRDRHLDRLDALARAAEGGYILVEPTPDGNRFNVTANVDNLQFGGGGQYESAIEISESGAKGEIDSEVLNEAHLKVSFEADYLPPRRKEADLPADGGEPGALLVEQMQAVASGDRDAILATLAPEQQEQFNQMSAEEQKEALSFLVDLTPRNVRATGGALYDGYAIVEFTGETDGTQVTGEALVSLEDGQWRVQEVSTKF